MEILEALFFGLDGCGCFLQIGALLLDVFTGAWGYRRHQTKKAARAEGITDWHPVRSAWPFWLLVFAAVFVTGLAAFKLLQNMR